MVHKDFRVDGLAFNGLNILMAKSELDSEREEFLLLLSNATARRKTGIIANLEIQTHTRERDWRQEIRKRQKEKQNHIRNRENREEPRKTLRNGRKKEN